MLITCTCTYKEPSLFSFTAPNILLLLGDKEKMEALLAPDEEHILLLFLHDTALLLPCVVVVRKWNTFGYYHFSRRWTESGLTY